MTTKRLTQHDNKLIATLAATSLLVGALYLTGCSSHLSTNLGSGPRIDISGDAEAIRAWMDGQTGLITTGKASPNMMDAYHLTRQQQEHEITKRDTRSWLDSLSSLISPSPLELAK